MHHLLTSWHADLLSRLQSSLLALVEVHCREGHPSSHLTPVKLSLHNLLPMQFALIAFLRESCDSAPSGSDRMAPSYRLINRQGCRSRPSFPVVGIIPELPWTHRRITKNLRITWLWAEIWTRYLPNAMWEIQLLGSSSDGILVYDPLNSYISRFVHFSA
jgi:hypothetical protein